MKSLNITLSNIPQNLETRYQNITSLKIQPKFNNTIHDISII